MTQVGRVQVWHDEEGWGVLDSAATPGGCWAHFSCVAVAGHRSLAAGEAVRFDAEPADQDGFAFRALAVWPADAAPVGREADVTGPSSAYESRLTLSFDEEP
jgi:CspA family cold shock protein